MAVNPVLETLHKVADVFKYPLFINQIFVGDGGEVLRIHNELKTTTVYVTYNLIEAIAIADRLAVMKKVTIQQVDTPEEVRNHPGNGFVEDFIKYSDISYYKESLMNQ